jgi:hypothetical protein
MSTLLLHLSAPVLAADPVSADEGSGGGGLSAENILNFTGLTKLALTVIAVLLLWTAVRNQTRADKGDIRKSASVTGVSAFSLVLVAMSGLTLTLVVFMKSVVRFVTGA